MSKKKGLSIEEKRTRMMEFFFEKKDFFQLKELERMCQKEKGITSMSVKDIVTSLVDDGMVDTDKIGTSIYFWAFPSKASQNCKRKISELENKRDELVKKKQGFKDQIQKASLGRESDEKRAMILSQLCAAEKENKQLEGEVEKYRECDPQVLEGVKSEAGVAKEAANRWTDNVFSTKSWIKNKFSFDDNTIDKQFGIPEDFDYVE